MPFKDRLQKLMYGREYQAKKRKELKELAELHEIEAQVVKIARVNIIGRCLFTTEMLPESGVQKPSKGEPISRLPVIHSDITTPITPQKIEEATLKVIEEEDKLLLVGEHKGWPACGIEGLATAPNRNALQSSGDIEKDLAETEEVLRYFGHEPPYSVVTNLKDPPLSTRSTGNWFKSKCLCSYEGKPDNVLVVKVDSINFKLIIGQDLSVFRLPSGGIKLWESLVPKICVPSAICEIQNVH